MKVTNKQTIKHQNHTITTRRAKPSSPHYGYYHCDTCNQFVTWITKEIYALEKIDQKQQEVMWFGKYQGVPLTDLPQPYLEWATKTIHKGIDKLQKEYLRRELNK
jgi:hypothetical protein